MSESQSSDLSDRTYARSGAVAELLLWLFENEHLRTSDVDEAQRLGEQHFEYLESLGKVGPDWREEIHIVLEDWPRAAKGQ